MGRVLVSLSILIAGLSIAGAIVWSYRVRVVSLSPGYYAVHDTWDRRGEVCAMGPTLQGGGIACFSRPRP